MGVLLNGERGTGKTVCAKYLANQLDLPIIMISNDCPGLNNFISSIKQDVVFFFDEFEKNFKRGSDEYDENQSGESLLSIMDGVYNTGFSHIFILTTNELRINKNFLSRPSRIRYLKTFSPVMSKELLGEIADDFLDDLTKKEDLIKFVSTLEFASIDIVKSIIEEINLHGCSIEEFKNFFNVSISEYTYCYWSTYYYEDSGKENSYTLEQFIEDVKNRNNDEVTVHDVYHNTSRVDRPFDQLAPGLTFRGDEIEYIDYDQKIIITHNMERGRKDFHKITSVFQKNLYAV
jgi:SpoVK/Ycf46/Vps4 family AAA+-type ATPase